MYHLCTNLYEGMKKRLFFTCLAFKGFVLRNNFSMNKKQLQKKLLFSCLESKAMPAAKKKKCLVCLCLSFKTSVRTTEVQHLLFFFRTSNQKVVLCTNEKLFFSLYFSFTRKQSSQQTNCFFFVNKTILK